MNKHTKFILSLVLCFTGLAGLVIFFNYKVDPYDIYQAERKHGFNQYVVYASGHSQRMVKARQISRLKPELLILGTSRADKGLEPEHPLLKNISPNSYNAAVGGGTIYEMKRYLEHALQYNKVSTIILGLDIEMFNAPLTRDRNFDKFISVNPDGSKNRSFAYRFLIPTLFSEDAFEASQKTIKESAKHDDISYSEMLKRGGAYEQKLFPVEKRYADFQDRLEEGRINLSSLNKRFHLIQERMQYFEGLLALCHQHDIDLKIYISPVHSALLDFLYSKKSVKMFTRWKKELVQANELAASAAAKEPFLIMDYSFHNPVTMDEAPNAEDLQKEMKHYLECSHFKKTVGDRIISHLIEGKSRGLPSRELTSEEIDDVLAFMVRRSKK